MSGSGTEGAILVLNAGSSSIKFAVFDSADLSPRLSGAVDGIGGDGLLRCGETKSEGRYADHEAALGAVLEALAERGITPGGLKAAGHRVVHGGLTLTDPVQVTDAVLEEIAACIPLAPLHNPHNLAAIRVLRQLAPDLPQCASFDTGFHATNPEVARRYALPSEIEARGIQRYGFHGTSYAALVEALPGLSGAPLPERLLALHLGNGASICAIREGRSVATTMGYSPLEGLTMGTRAGGLDANAVLRLAGEDGIEATARMLNHDSGLRGLSGGESDMRALLASDTDEARFAVAHFCYWAVRHAGSLIAAMGGLDAIAFTGGIGENSAPVRAEIAAGLGWLGLDFDAEANAARGTRLHKDGSRVTAWVVPAEEERRIARDALQVLTAD